MMTDMTKSKDTSQGQRTVKTGAATANNSTATTARQWELLNLLERGSWRGTHHLHEQLSLANFDVSLRTVQRDLNALSKRFPIEKNNAKPQGWRWKEDAPVQSLPHMNLSQAVAFNMVEANLAQLLPPTILDELFPWFDLARRQLKDSKITHNWLDRVRIEPATQPLIAPEICRECKDSIYQAIFYERQITACYTGRNKDNAGEYILNPIAIVQRGVVIYLLATKVDDEQQTIRTFALHRFTEVTVEEDTKAVIPDNFDLTSYLKYYLAAILFVHNLRHGVKRICLFERPFNKGGDVLILNKLKMLRDIHIGIHFFYFCDKELCFLLIILAGS